MGKWLGGLFSGDSSEKPATPDSSPNYSAGTNSGDSYGSNSSGNGNNPGGYSGSESGSVSNGHYDGMPLNDEEKDNRDNGRSWLDTEDILHLQPFEVTSSNSYSTDNQSEKSINQTSNSGEFFLQLELDLYVFGGGGLSLSLVINPNDWKESGIAGTYSYGIGFELAGSVNAGYAEKGIEGEVATFDGNAYIFGATISADETDDGIIGGSGGLGLGWGISAGVDHTVKILTINSIINSFNQNINTDDEPIF